LPNAIFFFAAMKQSKTGAIYEWLLVVALSRRTAWVEIHEIDMAKFRCPDEVCFDMHSCTINSQKRQGYVSRKRFQNSKSWRSK
jgi:hypothetical protein